MLFKKTRPSPTELVVTEDGFIKTGEESVAVKWNDITKVVGYKLDHFTTDEILFDVYASAQMVIVSEEFAGYKEWVKAIEKKLPNFDPNWWVKVAQPPFATNLTVLFER